MLWQIMLFRQCCQCSGAASAESACPIYASVPSDFRQPVSAVKSINSVITQYYSAARYAI
jgi:hypothetical protein